MYMVRDTHVRDPLPEGFKKINFKDLHDASDNPIGNDDKETAEVARLDLTASDGWFIELGTNEKVLSQLVTFQGRLLGTTFDVDEADLQDPCEAPGQNRFYAIDVATAQPVLDNGSDEVASITNGDRSQVVNGDGILSQPTILFPSEGDEIAIIVDNEVVSTFAQDFTRIFWHSR